MGQIIIGIDPDVERSGWARIDGGNAATLTLESLDFGTLAIRLLALMAEATKAGAGGKRTGVVQKRQPYLLALPEKFYRTAIKKKAKAGAKLTLALVYLCCNSTDVAAHRNKRRWPRHPQGSQSQL